MDRQHVCYFLTVAAFRALRMQVQFSFSFWSPCSEMEIFIILILENFSLILFCPQLPLLVHSSYTKNKLLFELFSYILSLFLHM